MANDVRNIIVGAADVYISTADTKATVPSWVNGTSASTTLAADAAYKGSGLTTGGVELSYAPNYGEVTVDQLLDAARLFKQSMQVMVRTTLAEGTLANMNLAFGQSSSKLVDAASSTTLAIGGGALGETPVERTVIFVGQAPYAFGTTGTAGSGRKERVYVARRVVQMETVSHSLRRDGATEFPVNFRCLPDTDINDGSEYGQIIDRVLS